MDKDARVLKLLITEKATPKNLVRLADKAFQMKIPIDSAGMEVTSRRIYNEPSNQLVESHAKKLHEMEKWENNPFKAMKLLQIGPVARHRHSILLPNAITAVP